MSKLDIKVFRTLVILILACCIFPEALGQTYAYRHKYSVDENGVKHSGSNGIVYITFVDNMSKFYPSDENGISKSYGDRIMGFGTVGICLYVGEIDNIHKYVVDISVKSSSYSGGYDPWGVGRLQNTFNNMNEEAGASIRKKVGGIYRFSSDFRKLNVQPYMTKDVGGLYDDVVDVYEIYSLGEEKSDFYE